ncbi:uncharacterized protein LOC119370780 [Jatropha curcas]|uniref:uncharacterized protein LOC119370780 n=1 Tax=Jatropha curcas TaxID=180498 RepID=UPI001894C50F|nr:uncharacterized protein LOC119370780 [Jatropha curcas]
MEEISNQSFSVTASNNNSKPTYPENYEACMDILLLIKKGYEFAKKLSLEGTKLFSKTKKSPTESPRGDAENQQATRSRSHELVPSNYDTCFDILKFVSKAMLVVLGFGSSDIRKLEDKKKKHSSS